MKIKQDHEIHQTIELIKEYLKILNILEEQQTDIADKIPFENMRLELLMAIRNLEYQLEKEKEEKPVLLATTVWSSSEIKKLHTKYLPGSICYVLQDNNLYILDTDHEWVKT